MPAVAIQPFASFSHISLFVISAPLWTRTLAAPSDCYGRSPCAANAQKKDDMYWGSPRHRRSLVWRQKCFSSSRRSR